MDQAGRRSDELMAEVVRRRGDALGAYAYLLTGDLREAEDLLQDALVKTFVRARGLELESAEGYLRRVMATTWVDRYRRHRQWDRVRHLFGRADSYDGPAEQVAERQDVQRALDGLSRQQRACVVLRFWDDLTVREIAGVLGVADGTVKRYLSTAVARLAEVLGPQTVLLPEETVLVEGGRP
jgi:RNA polymerase sigma-70 factor (ECF subfamily)